jgi:SpoVK/Ycf46/Vps4 family AAA+-type ATPase
VALPKLSRAMRCALWEHVAPVTPTPRPVTEWTLTPDAIVRAARALPAGDAAVAEACAPVAALGDGGAHRLVTPLPLPYTCDDLVLPAAVRRHLDELEAQARLRWSVYEDWGFGRLCPLGRGIVALLAGPSGTGKTMAAQVLARTLGLPLYRIDLAAVVSKYIGETEKNLAQIFDACERAQVVLFFDEADALFGQRTQTRDAHDRYANIEIDYLLQRLEQFDGIGLLATNRKGEIDAAFLRRIRFLIDFTQPGAAERRALWEKALPPRAPDGAPLLNAIDWEHLAQKLTLTGAEIKNAALGAAFLARAEGDGTRIEMRHVLHAARREMSKRGIVLRAEPGRPADGA